MKHNFKITIILLLMFLCAQYIGILVSNIYLERNLPFGVERPDMDEENSYISLFAIIFIATLLALLLSFLRAEKLWKLWFFLSVFATLTISLGAFFNEWTAFILGLIFSLWRLFKNNVIIHNFTELFIYGGLGAIFVPVLSLFSVSLLLILISIYDMIAVWKTKHMVKLARYQARLKIFAGMVIPYDKNKEAILGGGDIGFPVLFAGVILKSFGVLEALIIPLCAGAALFLLFLLAKKKKYYPAMPFISSGCFLGLLIAWLL